MKHNPHRLGILAAALAIILPACTMQQQGPRHDRTVREHHYPSTTPPRSTGSPTGYTASTPSSSLRYSRALTPPTTPAPTPKAKAIAVIDPKTGKLLYGHNAHTRRQVASTQKILTALCVIDAGRLNERATITRSDLTTPRIRMDLRAGSSYTRRDLLRALLMGSYNDVATTLARDSAGSVSAFMDRVNARAARMGMHNSHFVNPHGLPGSQYSTAYDMARAACWAYNNPTIRGIVDTAQYEFVLENGKTRRMRNTNKLLNRYPWVNGMKTGYTNAAGRCLISSGTLNGETVIVVVLGISPSQIWGESIKYLKWALKTP